MDVMLDLEGCYHRLNLTSCEVGVGVNWQRSSLRGRPFEGRDGEGASIVSELECILLF
jgi:hypothetical protein